MPAHVVYGDSFLVAGAVRRVLEDAGASDVMQSNHHRMVAAQTQPAEALAACNSLPFLDALRLVEIEGVLATEENAGGQRGEEDPIGGKPRRARDGCSLPRPFRRCPTPRC